MASIVNELNMTLLNKKMDRIIELLEKVIVKEKPKTKKEEEITTTWSTQEYKNGILVRFSFNMKFKDYVKELGAKWLVAKRAWIFPSSNTSFIDSIKEKFPEWEHTVLEAEPIKSSFVTEVVEIVEIEKEDKVAEVEFEVD
jgi:hypothetical protein